MNTQISMIDGMQFVLPVLADDGHGDYNRSYDKGYDDFDYADYSTDHRDNNFRNNLLFDVFIWNTD